MKNVSVKKNDSRRAGGLLIGLAVAAMFVRLDVMAVQLPVPLASATTFGALAASTVTSTGATTVNGDLGSAQELP